MAVLSASYRPPQIAAKMAADVDAIAGGRLVVGLGTGSDVAEHAAWGVRFGSPAERSAGVRRTLAVMQAMWDDPDGATIDGLLAGAPLRPLVRRPPVWLAAHGPVLLRHAGRHADGIIAAWSSPDELAGRVAVASAAAAAAGRPPLAVALYTFCLVGPLDAGRRRALVAAQAAHLGTSPERLLRWLGTTGLVGTGDEVRERLAAYAAAGADRRDPRPARTRAARGVRRTRRGAGADGRGTAGRTAARVRRAAARPTSSTPSSGATSPRAPARRRR